MNFRKAKKSSRWPQVSAVVSEIISKSASIHQHADQWKDVCIVSAAPQLSLTPGPAFFMCVFKAKENEGMRAV